MPSAGRSKTTKSSFRAELRYLLASAVRLDVPPSAVDKCLRELFLKGTSTCASTPGTSVCARFTNMAMWFSVLVLSLKLILLIYFEDMTIYKLYDALTYPGLRTARLLALPLLNQFPSLAQYHGRKCLVHNPFFKPMNESACWPCENFKSIVDLTGHPDTAHDYVLSLMPFVVKDALKLNISGEQVHQYLKAHPEITNDRSAKFYSTLRGVEEPRHLLELQEWQQVDDRYFQISWLCKIGRFTQLKTQILVITFLHCARKNEDPFTAVDTLIMMRDAEDIHDKQTRMLASPPAARILRKVFSRPYFVQNISEVSLQRFLLIDGPDAPSYYLPDADFSSSWLVQVEGSRLVVLEPSELCIRSCRQVSVLLKPNDILYFSDTLSKARSVPAHIGDMPSITYMGSFY